MLVKQFTGPNHKMNKLIHLARLARLAGVASFFLTSMYSAMVISVLTTGMNVEMIDTLEQLAHRFTDRRIYVNQGTFPHDVLKHSIYYPLLQSRIDVLPLSESREATEAMYTNVADGTHVFIDFKSNIKNDFQKKVSPEFLCDVSADQIRYSSKTFEIRASESIDIYLRLSVKAVTTVQLSWIYKKQFKYAEFLNQALLWQEAYGVLHDTHTIIGKIRDERNINGIFTPKKLDKPCPQLAPEQRHISPRVCTEFSTEDVKPLKQFHFISLWIIYAAHLGLAVAAFLVELVVGKCHAQKVSVRHYNIEKH